MMFLLLLPLLFACVLSHTQNSACVAGMHAHMLLCTLRRVVLSSLLDSASLRRVLRGVRYSVLLLLMTAMVLVIQITIIDDGADAHPHTQGFGCGVESCTACTVSHRGHAYMLTSVVGGNWWWQQCVWQV